VLPEEGLIRIWRRADTVLDRSAAEAGWTSGPQGDFVAPEVAYTEQDLEGEAFDEDGVVTLYIQGVRAGVGHGAILAGRGWRWPGRLRSGR
jgi:hypothetical protein